MSTAICAVCGGPIAPSQFPRGFRPAPDEWIHLDEEDWVNDIHQAVPKKAGAR